MQDGQDLSDFMLAALVCLLFLFFALYFCSKAFLRLYLPSPEECECCTGSTTCLLTSTTAPHLTEQMLIQLKLLKTSTRHNERDKKKVARETTSLEKVFPGNFSRHSAIRRTILWRPISIKTSKAGNSEALEWHVSTHR